MPSVAPTGRESDKFNLRLPDGMRDRIAAAAKASGRSMNAEIVARLEESFSTFGTVPPVSDLPERLAVFGGDIHALIASETIRLRELMERLEASREPHD